MRQACVFTFSSPYRHTGKVIDNVINMASYNYLGLAVKYDESMERVKDTLEKYGVGVASTRNEMGKSID